ncbi:nuclease domain-containing protein [Paenibacillus marinisediminis]
MAIFVEPVPALFSLRIQVGEGRDAEVFNIVPGQIAEPLPIKESLRLTIELIAAEPELQVGIAWGGIAHLDEEDGHEDAFELSVQNCHKVLYSYERDELYPWTCGRYAYQLRYGSHVYNGLFDIVPKNVTGNQLETIHTIINQHVQGLVQDGFATKQAGTEVRDLSGNNHWNYFNWYKTRERQLHEAVRYIQQHQESAYREGYVVQSQPKRQTRRSAMWEHSPQGMRVNETKFLNRRMVLEEDTQSAQLVKWQLKQLVRKMEEAMLSLREVSRRLEEERDSVVQELEARRNRKNAWEQTRMLAKEDRANLQTTISIQQQQKKRLDERLQSLQRLEEQYVKYKAALQHVLQHFFWKQISDRVPSRKMASHDGNWGVRVVDQISKESQAWGQSTRGTAAHAGTVSRPTPVLYEYYVFFKMIDVVKNMGFRVIEDNVYSQADNLLSMQGLKDGSYVMLERDKQRIGIIYDELIESHADTARSRGTYFYSSELKRKPDIRLDLYQADQYLSSLICEVKYRPWHAIRHAIVNTETMIQMAKYWAIGYITEQGKYVRNPVHQVICIFPGAEDQPILDEGQQGLFLQLYPRSLTETVGENELRDILRGWLDRSRAWNNSLYN